MTREQLQSITRRAHMMDPKDLLAIQDELMDKMEKDLTEEQFNDLLLIKECEAQLTRRETY